MKGSIFFNHASSYLLTANYASSESLNNRQARVYILQSISVLRLVYSLVVCLA
jgi:hypothetical protein